MKKYLILLLAAAMLFGTLGLPVCAAHVSANEAIHTLETLGLVRGTGAGFEPERCPARSEALVMLLRLLGKEAEAAREQDVCPFSDGGWAAPYLTYAWKNGLVKGKTETCFGSDDPVSVRDYLTLTLRALGYRDSGESPDFSWERSIAFADAIGLTHGEYKASDLFLREDMALVSYTALTLPVKGGGERLIDRLYLDGAVSAAALKTTRLASALSAGKPMYSAAEIYEQCSSAVLFVETYDSEEDYRSDRPSGCGSAFFITADGVAVLSYHELDGKTYARGTTTDGRRCELTGVLDWDPLWDSAVVRFSPTDDCGNTVRFFPWLERGDSDAVWQGEPVFTVGAPKKVRDSISSGIVSNRSHALDDPDYPGILFTAPISTGSSGGPLLSAHGEVLGFIFGYYIEGQNMNIAMPINCISGVDLHGAGTPLCEICAEMDARKAAAVLTASRTELTLKYGEEAELMISHDAPVRASITAMPDDPEIVSCRWGDYVTMRSAPLYLTGTADGETDVTVNFSDGIGGENSKVVIHVTVTGAPEERETETGEELTP